MGMKRRRVFVPVPFPFTDAVRECKGMRQKRAYRYRCYPHPRKPLCWRGHSVARVSSTTGPCGCAQTPTMSARNASAIVDISAALTTLKQQPETAWLNEVSSVPTQQAFGIWRPHFATSSRGAPSIRPSTRSTGQQSATYASTAFRWDAERRTLTLAKMDTPLAHPLVAPLARWR